MRAVTISALVLGLLPAVSVAAGPADVQPYQLASILASATFEAVQSGGILALKVFVPDSERALAGGRQAIDEAAAKGAILSDGGADAQGAMAAASKKGLDARIIPNPYPFLALQLGSYYNEVGRPEDAVRVLSLGLTLFVTDADAHLGRRWTYLKYERGAALVALKRFDEALAAYGELLQQPGLEKSMQARIHRARGFALTELGRLPEAEATYRQSLEIEPGNENALRELAYIERMKSGGQRAPGGLLPVQPGSDRRNEPGRAQ